MSTAETHVANKSRQYEGTIPIAALTQCKGFQIVLLSGGVMWRCKPHLLPREITVDLLILTPHHDQAAIAEAELNTLDC